VLKPAEESPAEKRRTEQEAREVSSPEAKRAQPQSRGPTRKAGELHGGSCFYEVHSQLEWQAKAASWRQP
jgi:hypothetical protein